MAKFESSIREIAATQHTVYAVLNDMSRIAQMTDKLPEDMRESLQFTEDGFSIASPMGSIEARVVDREEPKTIKLESVNSPLPFQFWIQLLPLGENHAKMKLTMQAELNFMMQQMAKGPLTKALEQLADVLQHLPYEALAERQ